MKVERILITTDFSDHARLAYRCAADLAKRFDAKLHLVHFSGASNPLLSDAIREKQIVLLVDALAAEAEHSCFADIDISPHLQPDRWAPACQKVMEQNLSIDLIVMAPSGKTGLSKVLLGSFADRVIRHASVPVLIFRPAENLDTLRASTVLIPHDFYESPTAVVPAMRLLANHFGSEFQFLHVYEPSLANTRSTHRMEREFASALKSPLAQPIEERFAQLVVDDLSGLDAKLETSQGLPAIQVVQRANQLPADLVLLGKREGLGSVARAVTREVKCSVLTMPVIAPVN